MEAILLFSTEQDAREYRYNNGVGGWIFTPDKTERAYYAWHMTILFPAHLTPSDILHHPITNGRSGQLIGA